MRNEVVFIDGKIVLKRYRDEADYAARLRTVQKEFPYLKVVADE